VHGHIVGAIWSKSRPPPWTMVLISLTVLDFVAYRRQRQNVAPAAARSSPTLFREQNPRQYPAVFG
jgi:hypothetical protein